MSVAITRKSQPEKKIPKLGVVDPSSYANPEKMRIKDMQLYLDIDFTQQILSGKVHLRCEKQENVKTNHLVLDVRDLKIFKVINLADQKELPFEIGPKFETFGSPLCITLPLKYEEVLSWGVNNTESNFVKGISLACKNSGAETSKESTVRIQWCICIEYETSSEASALQWLTPEQTLGKQAPFLFSQCQAIHCRSIIPCQDTPSVKFPFKAEITAPKDLTVLMGALRNEEPVPVGKNKMLWRFCQPVPIPSYLMAIVAGRLKGKVLGARSKVYCEPEIIKECAYEFAETDKMLTAATKICGPYVWGRYDLLVLPPSFPFGGMENPCLTFVTPTLLAGDRSLVNVVAHEIAHSWSGNLVTNVNFEHFWLNEGLTTYIERKIVGALYGEPRRHFQAILGVDALHETVVKTFGETDPLTCLVPKLKHIDPDDAFSSVPYEKGHTLLFYLETLLNEDGQFNKFLQSYLDKYKYQTVKTDTFKNYLYDYFRDKKDDLDNIDWDTWFYCPGMPPIIPNYDRSLVIDVENLLEKWESWVPTDDCLFGTIIFNKSDIDGLISDQKRLFLGKIFESDHISLKKVILMCQVYQMEEIKNAEVKFCWLRVCIKVRWNAIIADALKFVNEQGRVKYVRPIYRDLYQWEEARQAAIDNFLENKPYMMFVLSSQLEKDLHLNETPQSETK